MSTRKIPGARKVVFAGALSTTILCASVNGQTNAVLSPFLRDVEQNISFDTAMAFASKYVRGGGNVIGKGPVNQEGLNLNLGNYLTGTLWTDYDFANGKLDEMDLDVAAHARIVEIRSGPFKGTISGSLGLQDWKYPSGLVSKHQDFVLAPRITYNGPIDLSLVDYHLLDQGRWTWERNCFVFDASKNFEVAKYGENSFSLAPGLRMAYNDHFSNDTGIRYVAPGLTAGWKRGTWSINCFVRDQFNVSSKIQHLVYFGASVSVNDPIEGFREIGNLLRK